MHSNFVLGLFGPAAATALEDLPYDARGLLSGLFEQGYATGYLLASIFYRALVPTTSHGWRSLFWFGAGPPVLIIAFRWSLPETNMFQVMAAEREAQLIADKQTGDHSHVKSAAFKAWVRDSWVAIKQNWVLFVYLVVLMTGFNSCSHGSQDFYPTFLKNQVLLGPTDVTIISCIGQLGALIGGTTLGYVSTFFGRRLTMLVACVCGGALVPAYIIPHDMSLVASAFALQFFVGGAWGVIPIHLMEVVPEALRTTAVGLTYQLGNLASSASATIQAVIGERYPLPPHNGEKRFDYGKVIGIFMGAVWAYQILFLFLGPEMSEAERAEYAYQANELERLRQEGRSLKDIGVERVKSRQAEKGTNAEATDKATEGEHLEVA
ncbi:hypothetical protein CLAIMM_10146 isoform 1 [Cladophialophora immunda]|nr:hypothetical protein CLAIMM_10146 isoform 1 [Cladophialophora immunda]